MPTSNADPRAIRLVDLARVGDQDAFTALYEQSRPQIRAVGCEIFRGPGSEADLEDFCSDVCLLGLKYLGSFRGDCSFTTWIVQVARHKALAILQRRKQPKNGDGRLVHQSPEMKDEQWENQCSPVRQRDTAAAKFDIERLVRVLSPQQRELVELFHLRGLSEGEIAERQGIPLGTVRSRLSRAMKVLRNKISSPLGIDLGPFST